MSVPAPNLLTLPIASDDETAAIRGMIERLSVYNVANSMHGSYYDGTFQSKRYGFSIPPNMRDLDAVAGWGGTVVDVLDERLDWLGWRADGDVFDLASVYSENQLDVESGMAHLDALVYGTAFVVVGSGADGEPSPLVTVESPRTMTAVRDARRRMLREALAIETDEDGRVSRATYYTLGETATFEARNGMFVAVDRDRHNLPRLPVVQLANRLRASDVAGRSEITPAVRYYTDSAVRTLLGMEVHREFYQAPQRYAMNVDPSRFVDASGAQASPWQSIQGRVWAIPPNEDGDAEPSVGQFTPASPAPYIEQVQQLASMLAAEAGFDPSYLGILTSNPPSADAIRAAEARLVKRAERRQSSFGKAWLEVGRLALLIRDGSVPQEYPDVSVRWRDAATPTRAAAADEAAKLIGSGVLTPDSTVTYDRVGLDPDEQRQIAADKRRAGGSTAVRDRLREMAAEPGATDGAAD